MNIKIGKYILTVSLSKDDDIESFTDPNWIKEYNPNAVIFYTSDWKQFLGNDKIKAIRALRYHFWITKKMYPGLKASKEYVEWYAAKIGKPFPIPNINEMTQAINVVLGNTK